MSVESVHAVPRSPDEFLGELRALSERYWSTHPFHLRMHAGELSRAELRSWAANRWYYQSVLPCKDAAIISNCPLPEVRRAWLERIVYHDGAVEGEGGREHWLRLCEALGLSRAEVLDEQHVVPGARFAVDAYVRFARTQPWIIGIASGLTEMFSGHLMRRRVTDVLAHYPWISRDDLAYFTTRVDAVSDEGKVAVDLVLAHCRTRESQDAAIAALAFKCDVLWSLLDAIEHAAAER
ncbi:pyrroloquinoline-quinone synthase PqqC [Actinokineospora enzanensis]|uniref:pyrroloquinoline-quinone synthase PqqC n=1 Tax=Actinokineospora enzanensis TaxID=155975 RepID=UPI000382B600|nr:pyrroloquinoline-quinone synthase PqqC [Actinokineospora enzanensis]